MTAQRNAEPKVGIFFVVDGKHPFVDGMPVNQASDRWRLRQAA
jgi:hypothetical protein